MSFSVSVIIATYRRFEPLLNTIASLLQQEHDSFEIIIADQNPAWPENTLERKAKLEAKDNVHWHTLKEPGVVNARNFAASKATGEILVFVDDDVLILEKGFLALHVANYEDSEVACVSGREFDALNQDITAFTEKVKQQVEVDSQGTSPGEDDWTDKHPLSQCLGFNRETTPVRTRVCMFCTCNGSIRKSAFLSVYGFDENYTGNSYGDDFDLAFRLRAAGHTIIYDPKPWLIHLRAPAGGLRMSDKGNTFSFTEKAMSRCLFYVTYREPGWTWPLFKNAIKTTVLTRTSMKTPMTLVQASVGFFRALSIASERQRAGVRSRFKHSS